MPLLQYNIGGPYSLPAGVTTQYFISVPDSVIIDSCSCDVNLTAPDEGSGPDSTFLSLFLYGPSGTVNPLQNSTSEPLNGVNFDGDRSSLGGMNATFAGLNALLNWWIFEVNNFSGVDGVTNSFVLNINYTPAPTVVRYPSAPAATSIPAGKKYGIGGNVSAIHRMCFNLGAPSNGRIVDCIRKVPYNCSIEGVNIVIKNSGTVNDTKLSLYKVSSGVVSPIISEQLIVKPGANYYNSFFPSKLKLMDNVDIQYTKTLEKDDLLYVTADTAGINCSDISIMLTLKQRG